MIKFEINQSSGKAIPKKMIGGWIRKIEKTLKIKKNLEISFGVVGEAAIKNMNKVYRGKDKAADVLSFEEVDFKNQPASQGYIGEIIICYPEAVRRAKKSGQTINQELELLFVHGFMHLLGYNHKTKHQAEQMEQLEEKILSRRG